MGWSCAVGRGGSVVRFGLVHVRSIPCSFGMYKEICVKACLCKDDTSGSGFLLTQSFCKKSMQRFEHEAPGLVKPK